MIKMFAYEHKTGRSLENLILIRRIALTMAGFIAVPVIGAEAHSGEAAITCTNPYSGASFQVHVDYERSTVDSNPARIGAATISWQDDKSGRKYMLDRKSGNLTVTLASATGGNFLYDRCELDK